MIQHAKGNLIDLAISGQFDVIIHGCNCRNVMGSGIAKEIRERYPRAFKIDTAYHSALASDFDNPFIEKLGNYSEAWADTFTIINAYTQLDYLPRGKDHFDYESFSLILRKMLYRFPSDTRFGLPYIGMGLAGGDREKIIPLLEDFAEKVSRVGGSVTLVEFA